jgi:shikimate dehydrogenase
MRRVDGCWEGRNVDGAGFVRAAIADLDVDFRNARVTMFGAGAAARSVLDAVLQQGVDSVAVVTRRPVDVTGWPMLSDSRVTLTQHVTTSSDVVINATPVSLTGGTTLPKVPAYDYTAFIDLVYVPTETPWMREMREVSTRVANGLGMLLWQAKLQLDWWFNADVPISVLKAAVA